MPLYKGIICTKVEKDEDQYWVHMCIRDWGECCTNKGYPVVWNVTCWYKIAKLGQDIAV